jgi:hypothetical protein
MVFVINLSPRSLSRSKSARYPAAMTSMALFSVSSFDLGLELLDLGFESVKIHRMVTTR